MIDEWQPQAAINEINITLLRVICGQTLPATASQIPDIDSDQQQQLAGFIKSNEQQWQPILAQLSQHELIALAFFYTRAEEKWSNFVAGSDNPAIWIFRYLKRQKELPPKVVIKQLKDETKNRFIPYGSVL